MKNDSIKNVKRLKYLDFTTKFNDYSSPTMEIPGFQRNFVWQNKKISTFVESIIENKDAFYIGNLLIQEGGRSGSPNLVVDGQQRIVTLSLVLVAVLNDPEANSSIKKMASDMLYVSRTKPRLSFERSGVNYVYSNILKNKLDFDTKDKFLRNFLSKYKYIKKVVRGLDANDLVNKIKNLQLVVINCSSTHDVITLYQGLNSTSKKLEPAELIKSLIVGDSSKSKKLWIKLEKSFYERNPIWLDKFFRQHWFSIDGYVSGDQLYPKIKKYLNDNPFYLREVSNLSSIYLSMRDADINHKSFPWNKMRKSSRRELHYILETIKSLRLDQVYAPLIALVKYGNNHSPYLTNSLLFADFYRIYSFLILFKFSNSNPNKVERLFATFCKDISNKQVNDKKFNLIKEYFFKELSKEVPSKEMFISKLTESVKYSKKEEIGDRQLVESVLSIFLLEDGVVAPPPCDIEHIFPEGSEYSKWKISNLAKKEMVDNKLRFNIGNLTLLKPFDNQEKAKTNSFEIKYKEVFEEDKVFTKNKELRIYRFDEPDVHLAVKKRAEAIAEFVYTKLRKSLYDDRK